MLIFSGAIVLPQTLKVGFFSARYFGLIFALAVWAGYRLAEKRAPLFGVSAEQADNIMIWLMIGGFIGARLYHILSSLPYYLQNPVEIFIVWHGGLSVIGALLGGLLTLCVIVIRKGYGKVPTFLDWLAPSMALGQVIGRFGDLFNYELFGYPTNLPWKMFVPEIFRPSVFAGSSFFHPLFLYESLGNAMILWVLLKRIRPTNPGKIFFTYLMSYGILRFALEFFRIDSVFVGALRLNAMVSLVFIASSFAYFYLSKVGGKKLKVRA
ncbi:MAG: prolipoprotein diacylglyceryl transferase [bacterium]|nr:prolipoprotein diacylglyceryl transferase [bacterium]